MKRSSHPSRFLTGLIPLFSFVFLVGSAPAPQQNAAGQVPPQEPPCTECCTSLLVGPEASVDGSTMTSHSCDSGTDRTWISLEPRKSHPAGSMATLWLQPKRTTQAP